LPRRPRAVGVASRVRPVWTEASHMNRQVAAESRLEGGVNRAKLKFSKIITTTSRVSVRNIIESTREGAKQIASKIKSVTCGFVLPRFGSRKPTPR
jgi:hypothetical protein